MTTSYHLKNIRALLTEGLSEDEIRQLCFDIVDFRPVYDQLTQNISKAQIIHLLVEHIDRKELLDPLLVWVKESNIARYKKHQPYFYSTPNLVRRISLRIGLFVRVLIALTVIVLVVLMRLELANIVLLAFKARSSSITPPLVEESISTASPAVLPNMLTPSLASMSVPNVSANTCMPPTLPDDIFTHNVHVVICHVYGHFVVYERKSNNTSPKSVISNLPPGIYYLYSCTDGVNTSPSAPYLIITPGP